MVIMMSCQDGDIISNGFYLLKIMINRKNWGWKTDYFGI